MSHQEHQTCISACVECAQECEHCANACLSESGPGKMARCIRLDIDCAQICWTASAFMSRGSQSIADICELCAEICDACGDECEKHAEDHCKRCAEACRRCAGECRRMVAELV